MNVQRLSLRCPTLLNNREEQSSLLTPTGCVVRATNCAKPLIFGGRLLLLYNPAYHRTVRDFQASPLHLRERCVGQRRNKKGASSLFTI